MRLGEVRFSRSRALLALAVIVLATLACLSPVHNDTWWHLAYGREMAERGGFAQMDWFSHTAEGRPFPNHQWLGERALYSAFVIGGLPLVTAFCACLLTTAWVLCWRLSRGPLLDRLLVLAAGVAGSTLVWSIRPQIFTIVLLPTVVTLLVRRRLTLVPLVMLLWANLHGGVLLGLLAIGTFVAVSAVYERRALLAHALCLAASFAATVLTPLGLDYWPEIVRSLQRSQVNRLHEWQAPGLPPEQLFFWAAAAALVALAAAKWRSLSSSTDRAMVAIPLMLLPVAARSLRNVAPFMMLAAPALTRLLDTGARQEEVFDSRRSAGGAIAVAAAATIALILVGRAWIVPWQRLGWEPVSTGAAYAIRSCQGPLYNSYTDGGPIIWFVPGRKVFLDSRQDQFPMALVRDATAAENGADPRPLLDRYGIRCVALPPTSPTVATLTANGWRVTYADAAWVVATR